MKFIKIKNYYVYPFFREITEVSESFLPVRGAQGLGFFLRLQN